MASLVTGRYPFFDGGEEDPAALAEVALLCGEISFHRPPHCVLGNTG